MVSGKAPSLVKSSTIMQVQVDRCPSPAGGCGKGYLRPKSLVWPPAPCQRCCSRSFREPSVSAELSPGPADSSLGQGPFLSACMFAYFCFTQWTPGEAATQNPAFSTHAKVLLLASAQWNSHTSPRNTQFLFLCFPIAFYICHSLTKLCALS